MTSARFPQPHVLTFSPLREKEEESDHLSPFANREKTKEGQRKKLRMFRISFHGSRTREAAKQRVSSYLFCIFRSLQTPRPSEKAQKTFLFIWGPICIPRSSFYSFPFFERDPRQELYLKMSQRHCFKFYLPPAHNAFPPFFCVVLGDISAGVFFLGKNRNSTPFINRAFQRWTKQKFYILRFWSFCRIAQRYKSRPVLPQTVSGFEQ